MLSRGTEKEAKPKAAKKKTSKSKANMFDSDEEETTAEDADDPHLAALKVAPFSSSFELKYNYITKNTILGEVQ